MKLVPKAKPVKMRIRSGGEEHSTIETLRENFSYKDLLPLLDGRLGRWLMQQGERSLAEHLNSKVESFWQTSQGIVLLFKLFFYELNHAKNVIEIVEIWSSDNSRSKQLEYLLSEISFSKDEIIQICDLCRVGKLKMDSNKLISFFVGKPHTNDPHVFKAFEKLYNGNSVGSKKRTENSNYSDVKSGGFEYNLQNGSLQPKTTFEKRAMSLFQELERIQRKIIDSMSAKEKSMNFIISDGNQSIKQWMSKFRVSVNHDQQLMLYAKTAQYCFCQLTKGFTAPYSLQVDKDIHVVLKKANISVDNPNVQFSQVLFKILKLMCAQ